MQTAAVKKERFYQFDVARAFSILLLPLIHVFEELESRELLAPDVVSGWRIPILYLCIYAPSLFMILFGTNLKFAKEQAPAEYAKRGVHFLLIGVLLNVLRFGIPAVAGLIAGNTGPLLTFIVATLQSDIYDFIGLFLLLFALMKKLRLSGGWMLIISLALLTVSNYVNGFDTGSMLLNCFLGRFIYVDANSCFPVMTWTVFPVIGYIFAELYQNMRDERERAKLHIFLICAELALEFAFEASFIKYGMDWKQFYISPANSYYTDIVNTVLMSCVAFGVFGVFYFIYRRFAGSPPVRFLMKISGWIMPFYFIQWIIVGWLEGGLSIANAPEGSIGTAVFILLMAGALIATVLLTFLFGDRINDLLKYRPKSARPLPEKTGETA